MPCACMTLCDLECSKKELPEISNTMLANCLRELEKDDLIPRRQYYQIPPKVEYSFTEMGNDLKLIFCQIVLWGFRHEKELETYSFQ